MTTTIDKLIEMSIVDNGLDKEEVNEEEVNESSEFVQLRRMLLDLGSDSVSTTALTKVRDFAKTMDAKKFHSAAQRSSYGDGLYTLMKKHGVHLNENYLDESIDNIDESKQKVEKLFNMIGDIYDKDWKPNKSKVRKAQKFAETIDLKDYQKVSNRMIIPLTGIEKIMSSFNIVIGGADKPSK